MLLPPSAYPFLASLQKRQDGENRRPDITPLLTASSSIAFFLQAHVYFLFPKLQASHLDRAFTNMARMQDGQVKSLFEHSKDVSFDGEKLAAVPEKYQGTPHDQKEMNMMGKEQVLRVRAASVKFGNAFQIVRNGSLDVVDKVNVAQLQILQYAGLCKHGHG